LTLTIDCPYRIAPAAIRRATWGWEVRQRAASRVLEQRGYDPTTAAQWSADGMTDRAQRYLAKLEHGRWTLPERFGQGENE
jgi:hypothetical protein